MDPAKAAAGIMVGGVLFVFIAFALGAAYFILWLAALINCATRKSSEDKVAWVLIIIFVPLFGAIFYFVMGRPKPTPLLPKSAQPPMLSGSMPPSFTSTQTQANDPDALSDERRRAKSINQALSTEATKSRRSNQS
jgi:hypothetical protein